MVVKRLAVLAATGIIATSPITAMADGIEGVDYGKTYLSIGADLTNAEKDAVYDLLGVDENKVIEDNVQIVTNEDEHKYLGSYIPSDKIGTRALSSVLITDAKKGSGINVETHNITYCTEGMYENALATAGATDVSVVVAGPFNISGTAALVGAIKAYSDKEDVKIDDETIDTAVDEMITTGELSDAIQDDPENVEATNENIEGLIAWLKEQVANGKTNDYDSLLDEGQEKYNISLTDEQEQQIKDLLEKISKLDLDVDSLKQQLDNVSDKLDNLGINQENTQSLLQKIIDFLQGIFSKFGN